MTPHQTRSLLDIALDLASGLNTGERYARMVAAVRQVVPCDSAVILALDNGVLRPLAADGLSPTALALRFDPAEHPRLKDILAAPGPIRFANDDPRPDPFDGLIDGDHHHLTVHSCMGAPLRVDGELVGAIAVDALVPTAFDTVDDTAFATVAALAAATLKSAGVIEALAHVAKQKEAVARQLVREALARDGGGALVGTSAGIADLRRQIDVVARSDLPVLITGETGVGKELVARTVHAHSPRADQALVYVNCAALPESIAESELFGHKRGAFTGAIADRAGRFELAHKGTIFLDEIGELPLSVQAKLLRTIQFGELQRVGEDQVRRVDLRIVAATNRDLQQEVAAGRFRADLFHRLNVDPLPVPPLRDRPADIDVLAGHFLDRARARLGTPAMRLSASSREALQAHTWPGNVRELEHVMLRAALGARASTPPATGIGPEHLCLPMSAKRAALSAVAVSSSSSSQSSSMASPACAEPPLPVGSFHDAVVAYQRQLLETAIAQADGNLAAAARALGLDRSNMHRLARRLGVVLADAPAPPARAHKTQPTWV